MRWMLLALLFLSNIAWAQKRDTLKLSEIEVVERLKASVTPGRKIELAPSGKSIAQVLEQNSSVYVKNYGPGSLSSISLRGASASQTQVLWNGILLNNPLSGQVDLSLIPSFLIESASISDQGNLDGSMGGNVLLNSASFKSKQFIKGKTSQLKFSQQLGSFGSNATALQGFYKNKELFVNLQLYRIASQNNFTFYNTALQHHELQTQTHANFKQQGVQVSLERWWKKSRFSFVLWQQEYQRNLPTVMSYQGAGRLETQTDADVRMQLGYQYYVGNAIFQYQFSYSDLKNQYQLANNISEDWVAFIKSKSSARIFTQKLAWKQTWNGFKFSGGIQHKSEAGKYGDLLQSTTRRTERTVWKPYVSLLRKLPVSSTNIYAEAKASSQLIAAQIPQHSYRFTLKNQSKNGSWEQGIFVERNIRIPTLNDLNWFPGGNANLLPENALGWNVYSEFRSKSSHATWLVHPHVYYRKVENWIQWRPSELAYWKPFNLGEVTSVGGEITIENSYIISGNGEQKIENKSTLNLGYNRAYESQQPEKTQLIYTPKWVGNFWNSTQINKVAFAWGLQYVGKRETRTLVNQASFHDLNNYVLLNLKLGYQKQWKYVEMQAHVQVNNVLNTSYQNVLWRAMPRRNLECVLTLVL